MTELTTLPGPERRPMLMVRPEDHRRALALRQMAMAYADLPRYLLLPEVSALLHYLPDWSQHALVSTLWNTGGRINEVLALKRRDFRLNGDYPHVVIRTAKPAPAVRPRENRQTAWCLYPIRGLWTSCADCSPARVKGLRPMRKPVNVVRSPSGRRPTEPCETG